jgi:hypothetical protein
MTPLKKMAILLLSLLILAIVIWAVESSAIIHMISPSATAQPTVAYPSVNGVGQVDTPTPDPYTGTLEGLKVHGDNYNDSYGLTKGQKMDAIRLALDNSTVKESIKEFENISPVLLIGPVALSDQDIRSGYLDLPNIANVPMQFGESFTQQNFIVYVDFRNNTVIGIERWWPKEDIQLYIPIPSGASWYHKLMGPWVNASDDMSRIELDFHVIYSPDDARIYPAIVDESNFSMLKNNSTFSAVRYVDFMTDLSTMYDGTKPIVPVWTMNGSGSWDPHMSLGDANIPNYFNQVHPTYYMVLRNLDNRTVYISNFNMGS